MDFFQDKDLLEKLLLKSGGVLLRGFDITSVSTFNRFAHSVLGNLLEYENASTPRTRIGGKIYTSTEYPAEKVIHMHNENSYSYSWPNTVMFYSVIAAETGGETPVADSRQILAALDKDVVDEFRNRGVMYTRNYTNGIDLSWQDVFQTNSRDEVEKKCLSMGVKAEWLEDGQKLRTSEIRQATIHHPITGEEAWFNQANLFHISAQSKQDQELICSLFSQNDLPRNAYFGDGGEIPPSMIQHINDCYRKNSIQYSWVPGDCMILDNHLMAHGRSPYTGDRKVVVAMG